MPTIAVNSASPYRTLKDFLDDARGRPNAITLASIGPATPYHLGLQTLQKAAGVSITYVPFAGATPVVNALLGQHVTSMIGSYSNVAGRVEAGRLRVLAVADEKRLAALPNVPTVAETYKGFNIPVWFGVAAPARTPPAAPAGTIGWFKDAMRAPDIVGKLDAQGQYPAVICGDEFGALLRQEYDAAGRVIALVETSKPTDQRLRRGSAHLQFVPAQAGPTQCFSQRSAPLYAGSPAIAVRRDRKFA